jgi:two-component system NarL family sensor kinase
MREHEFLETHTAFFSPPADAGTSATYLSALIENSPIAIVILDAQHRFQMCNPSFERLFQFTHKELLSADLDSLISGPGEMDEAIRLSGLVLEGQKVHTVAQRRRRDSMIVDVEIYGIPLIVNGELIGVYGLYQDVTERNKAQSAYHEISHQMENVQQEERRRIARDLHDSTAQELTVLNWNLTRLRSLLNKSDPTLQRLVQETQDIAQQCSSRIRSASYLLHPPLLGLAGLTLALPRLSEGFEKRSGIRVTLDISADLGRFPDVIEIAVFRIVQEGLANVMRHSGSSVARIILHRLEGWLHLELSDEGKGHEREVLFQARDSRSGLGISGMRERIEELGGCLRISCDSNGTTLFATVPAVAEHRG